MTVGIFTAMDKEAAAFLNGEYTMLSDGDFAVYKFKIGSADVVLCCPPTVGEIAASAACQLLITKYGAEVILNFGVVGALTQNMSLCSTAYVSSVVHYDMDTSAIDGLPRGRYGCFDGIAVGCDERLLSIAVDACRLPLATCASADKFVSDPKLKTALYADFGAQICDMESAGVLFACRFNRIPCLLVKCISDSLIGGGEEYAANCRKATAGFMELAQAVVNKLTSK
ncbi:MAG: 5'-methylthioadenosine/S-adenosylhomocysteine nucleosidase [Corallococcus sp.]|nr:5'-methylthioadenosine/S-adenosylhomocysteine nucleosidase [Corallococcus sp.]